MKIFLQSGRSETVSYMPGTSKAVTSKQECRLTFLLNKLKRNEKANMNTCIPEIRHIPVIQI